jgi:hypothetical protein
MAGVAADFTVLGEARRGVFSYDKRIFQALAQQLKDGHYEIHVQRLQANRSLPQNRHYWKCVIGPIAEYTGYTPNETHEAMKQMFLPKELAFLDGNGDVRGQLVMGGSTRSLTVVEFMKYVKQVQRFAAEELGVMTPVDDL